MNLPTFNLTLIQPDTDSHSYTEFTIQVTPDAIHGRHATQRTFKAWADSEHTVAIYCKWLSRVESCKNSKLLNIMRTYTLIK